MRVTARLLAGSLILAASGPGQELVALAPQAGVGREPVEARIWLDRVDPVLQRGDRLRVYYRSSRDAYVAVFHVDTEGVVKLALPNGPQDELYRVRGGSDYRLRLPESSDWLVEGDPGVGYFFVLASEIPFDFGRLSTVAGTGEWELARSGVRIDQDPYLAIDGLTRLILPAREFVDMALDFTAYHVGQSFSYPRFLCYQCHQPQFFTSRDPYQVACSSVRVVIFNDPYFYPVTRYEGTRVAFARPPDPGLPQFVFRERAAGEPGTPLVQNRPGPAGQRYYGMEMLDLLERAGVVAPEPGRAQRVPSPLMPPLGGPGSGAQDPRIPVVLTPASGAGEDRPVLQRRADQQGDPQPR